MSPQIIVFLIFIAIIVIGSVHTIARIFMYTVEHETGEDNEIAGS